MAEDLTKERQRIEELVRILDEASRAYYATEKEIMSNIEYDRLYDELVELEKKTGIVLSSSPTHKVGYEIVSSLPKVVHVSPMLSLDKTKSVEALAAFAGEHKSLLSWKMDGLTIVLTYASGELKSAVTRGNGEVGELITANARTFKNVPLRIPYEGELVVRGEAVISYNDFELINSSLPEGEEVYKNPRNLCSGSVRQLNSEITARRNVNFFAFGLVSAAGVDFMNSHEQEFVWLKSQGFDVVEYMVCDGSSVADCVATYSDKIESYAYPTDGLVLMYDNIEYGTSLGRTAKFPRNAIAFKWKDEKRQTILREVEWSPSRTGLINPVAVFDTVELEGTEVSRASLHNLSYIEDLMLGIGDEITVYKANMIIPQIDENLTKSGNLQIPDKCPVCQKELEIRDQNGSKTLVCSNPECLAKHIKSLTHFVERDCFNIEGLSESTLEKFVEMGLLHDISDIYELPKHEEVITNTKGFGKKGFDNMVASIEKSKDVAMENFLNSLGIAGLGLSNSKLLKKHFDNDLEKLFAASVEELTAIDRIGDVLAANIRTFLDSEKNMAVVRKLLAVVRITKSEATVENSKIGGKTFVITGSLENFKNRAELKNIIEQNGGKVASAVSASTDYLINNDVTSNSKKNQDARKLGVTIISEADVQDMLQGV